ncbi:MAG: CaiB/BaiF CoA transferase family protein [Acidimicrobiales bacterium]
MNQTTASAQTGVLNGVRVVELAMWIAGPSAGGLMADWGADVIKVEAPGGDPQRNILSTLGYGDLEVPGFTLDNRGKRSVELDLATERGTAAMEALLESADVFLTNMRPQSLEQFELAPEQVHARHPGLVVTTITGYGLDGEEAWRPGYDIGAFWARAGIARDLVGREEAPIPVRGGLGDHFTGMTAAAGTMAALLERTTSGKGRIVEASLLRTGVWAIGHQVVVQEQFGRLQSAKPREISPTPMLNSYRAGDGKWFWLIAVEADRHYPGLLAAIARPDLATDERFLDAKLRKDNAEVFVAELDEVFASNSMEHWAARFDEHDVWWSPANSIAEVMDDPQIHASGAFVNVEQSDRDDIRSVNSPITFRDLPLTSTPPAPAVGEHTAEVLSEIGFED